MNNQRIEYIDLMKGICMIMVILLHCGFFKEGIRAHLFSYISNFFMPLYFFITGLFFKSNETFKILLIKRTNSLIIPYLFFSIILFIPHIFVNPYNQDISSWQYYFFGLIEPYNYPLWFLRCLFCVYILYYCLRKITSNSNFRIIISFLFSSITWFITPIIKESGNILLEWIFIHMNLLTALYVLPYIGVAEYLKEKRFLKGKCPLIIKLTAFIICLFILIKFKVNNIDLPHGCFGYNLIAFYFSSFAGIFAIMFLSQIVKKNFFVSYIGRYSLIALGCHVIIIITLKGIFQHITEWQLSIIVLLLCPLFIHLFAKIFPYFTAQKSLIHIPSH